MKILSILGVVIGVLGLIGIRVVEDRIFYDPFLNYFHESNANTEFPAFSWFQLILSHLGRFVLNLLFSLVIVQSLFRNIQWTLQALIMIVLVFVITLPVYLVCVYHQFEIGYLFSFYVRRLVIQPLIVLLIVPMFYYRRQKQMG
ncbi:MAG: exosortase F system-associated protein [Bacteroidetes bacterium]|nr:exosortase F system-associated protein [Bacteroidota bacterium]